MATEITDQQSALKDAMARAQEIAAKLQEEEDSEEEIASDEYESRKRRYRESEVEVEPNAKKTCDEDNEDENSDENSDDIGDNSNGFIQDEFKNGLNKNNHENVIHKSLYESSDSDSSDENNQNQVGHQEIVNEVNDIPQEEEGQYDENDEESEEEEIEYPRIHNEVVTTHLENNLQRDVTHDDEDRENDFQEENANENVGKVTEAQKSLENYDDEVEKERSEKNDEEIITKNIEDTQEVKPDGKLDESKKEAKIVKGPMLVEEVMVPTKLIGLIIGRGHEMITKLQSESGAKIQVNSDDTSDSEEKPVTITGAVDSVNKAKALIDEIQQTGRIPDHLLSATVEGEFSVQIDIPKGKVGLIIGKGGETIKGLQEQAGCKMVMYQDGEYANSSEKPLCISGDESAVMYAKQLVEDILEGKEPEGLYGYGDYGNTEEGGKYKEIDVPKSSVGLVIGSKGANIHYIQMETGCRVQFNNEMEGPSKKCMLSGEPYQVAAAEQMIMDIISGNSGGPRPPFNNMGSRPPFGPRGGWDSHMGPHSHQGWGPPRHVGRSNLPPDHKEMSIEVPANKCGIVIGKGGETIKAIKNETKANLQLNRNIPDNLPYKVFTVTGTDEMIENVLNMIRNKIQDQSIIAKPSDGSNQMGQAQNHWGAQASMGWGQQHHNQWNYQQAWNGQQHWGQQQQHNPWGHSAQAWNQSMQQPTWDPQQQQWQQNTAGQWGTQQQWSQPAQTYQAGPTSAAAQQSSSSVTSTTQAQSAANGSTAASTTTTQSSTGQPDYSAAWALYYQQQQQYYQQYYQQAAVSSSVTGASTAVAAQSAATVQSQTAAATATTNSQAQAMADYQAKLKEYYKQIGQQPPQ